jgi:shikimate kinase
MASKEIKVYGELVSQTLSGKTVDTDNVIDETMNMNQTEIN